MLITLLLPTSGSARVLGHDVVDDPREVRRRVGYVFGGDRGLYERLSGLDNLRYFAELYGVPAREQKARIGELLELVGLTGREKERVEGYSRGCGSGCTSPAACCTSPRCSSSTSRPSASTRSVPASCAPRWRDLGEPGTTVLLTTHYMFEADELCDRIAVIADGRIVAEGTPAELKSARRRRLASSRSRCSASPDRCSPACARCPGVRSAVVEERGQSAAPRGAGRARGRGHPAGAGAA